ncbi:MAG: ATP-dependent DNA helicase [Euryarchaeota archaeon]|nr:ATP-dependent DNA helicase [Euryarchaeota archaeon]
MLRRTVEFFPYSPRPFQEVARNLVEEAAETGSSLVMEMPTGSGKTVVTLAGALAAARRAGKKVLYVTRTNSQQQHAVHEFNEIRKASGLAMRAVALQGRARLCLKLEDTQDPEWQDATPEELGHFCTAAKAATDKGPSGPKACVYWSGLQSMNAEDLRAFVGDEARTAEWLKSAARERGICPYEATKKLIFDADLVIAPYFFAVDAGVNQRLMFLWGTRPEDVILIVDEAHNVPDYLRQLGSARLSRETLHRAATEAKELGYPEAAPHIPSKLLLDTIGFAIEDVVKTFVVDDDGFLPPFEFETRLLDRFTTTTRTLQIAAEALQQMGEAIKDRRRLLGRIPRSYLAKVGRFLAAWLQTESDTHVRLAGRTPSPHLEAFLVDPSLAADAIRSFHASIHVSGTLDPLQEYRDALGLAEDTKLERFPSPFPADGLRVRVVEGVSTRYGSLSTDPAAVDELQAAVRAVIGATRVNAACFFPSHRMMEEFREVGVLDGLGDAALFETKGVGQEGLMRLLAQHRSSTTASVLVGVLGGRISEGLDFPGRELEAMVIVGVPYPKPSAHQRALFHYYEAKFGKGWDYGVRAPALRRIRQAVGRLIRSETDRGFAIILDERANLLLRSGGVEAESGTLSRVVEEFSAWQAEPVSAAEPRAH